MRSSFPTAIILALYTVSGLSHGNETTIPNLRKLRITSSKPGKSITANASHSRSFQGDTDSVQGKDGGYALTFGVSPGVEISVKSNPRKGLIKIRRNGKKSAVLTADDKQFLRDLANSLDGDASIATVDVDEVGTQSSRAARLLADWPDGLAMLYDYTPANETLKPPLTAAELASPDPSSFPTVPGTNRALATASMPEREEDASGHHYRRSGYTRWCDRLNTYQTVTHDDNKYPRGADQTTYYAYISTIGDGPCSGATYFWKNGVWQCYTPDHDPDVEYAYGGCFGRCGAGCSAGGVYSKDCADHDRCVFDFALANLYTSHRTYPPLFGLV